jgi:hypothetical protein
MPGLCVLYALRSTGGGGDNADGRVRTWIAADCLGMQAVVSSPSTDCLSTEIDYVSVEELV